MNTRYLIISACLFGAMTLAGTNASAQDTLVVKHPAEVTVVSSSNYLSISIKGKEGDQSFRYSSSIDVPVDEAFSRSYSIRPQIEFLDLDILKTADQKKRNASRYYEKTLNLETITDFEIGSTFGMNEVSPMSVSPAFASDFRWSVTGVGFRPFHNGFRLVSDIAIGKTTTRLAGKDQFGMDSDVLSIVPTPSGITKKKTIVRNFVFSSSLLAGIAISSDVELFGGVQGDVNFPGTAVNKYTANDKREKGKLHDVKMNTFTYGYKAGVIIKDFGVYCKYSPCQAVKSGFGPEWERFAIGIIIR